MLNTGGTKTLGKVVQLDKTKVQDHRGDPLPRHQQ